MKITVQDCLSLDVFKGSIVAAGEKNLDRPVKSVSVLDASDVDTAVTNNGVNGQLVLTSFYGMTGKERLQAEVVQALSQSGISGFVVFNAVNGITKDDRIIIDKAEELGLPFIIMNPECSTGYSEAIEQIMDKMLYNENVRDNLINDMIFDLLNFERNTGFPAALREAALSNELQIILLSKDFNPILVVETEYRATVNEAIRSLKSQRSTAFEMYAPLDLENVAAYWGTVKIENDDYMLIIVDNKDQYTPGEITKLAEIIQLAIGMWKYTPERDLNAEFIKSLARGNKSLAYTLKDELGLANGDVLSVFLAREIENQAGQKVITYFEENQGIEVLRIREGEETYGIVKKGVGSEELEMQTLKARCNALFSQLKAGAKKVRIYHSTGVDGIEGAADGFRLISETFTSAGYVFPYKRVFTKYDMVLVSNCINIQLNGGYLKKNYDELLEPFDKELGANKARQLLETLETFVLDAGMNSAKTSEFMGIHTNTVQYRLKRINEILGVEITGNRVIPGLTIAIALLRLERAGR